MRLLGIGIAAAMALAALSPVAAHAQGRGKDRAEAGAPKIDEKLRAQGMTEAPPLAKSAGIACQVTDARFIGKSEDKKAKTSQSFYEVDCDQGPGFVVRSQSAVPTPDAFSCFETAKPTADGKPNDLACILPGNANLSVAANEMVTKAGVACDVDKVRGIGQSTSNSFVEVGCKSGGGYILQASVPISVTQPITATTCLAFGDTGNIKCELTDSAALLKVADNLIGQANKGCVVKDRRYILTTKDGSNFYELACNDGKGYVVEEKANGQFARAIDCANADFVGGGCRLTDSTAAKTEQAGLYTSLAKKANFDCTVAEYAPRQTTADREVVELKCSNRPDGAIAIFPRTGAAQVLDCGHAELMQFRCGINKGPSNYAKLTQELKANNNSTCSVSETRLVGKTNSGQMIMEVACADGLAGYIMEYNLTPIKLDKATACPLAKGMYGGCKLAANNKGQGG